MQVEGKVKAGQVWKWCPNFQCYPTPSHSCQRAGWVPPISAAPAVAWGLLAGRRHPARMGGCIHVGLFRVGQAVLSFLLTLCALLQVGREERTTLWHQFCWLTLPCPLEICVNDNFLHLKALLQPGKVYQAFIQGTLRQIIFFFLSQRVGFYHSTGHGIVFPNIPLRRMYFSKYCHSLL